MKGTKISIVFPSHIYTFLQELVTKMSKIPATNPNTGKPIVDPKTGKTVMLAQTGKVEELIHGCILSQVIPLIQQHPSFADEVPKLTKFVTDYGNYLSTLGDVSKNTQKV